MPSDTRFEPEAAEALRAAIAESGGVEVFAIGRTDERGRIIDLEVHARGNAEAVPALTSRPRPGEVVIHNHPSGDPTPSQEDIHTTRRLQQAGEILGIRVLDHIVVAEDGFVSLRERGLLN